MKPSRIDGLLEQLASDDPDVRVGALESLREFAGNRQAYHAIRERTRDPDADVRRLAQVVLEEYDQAWDSALAVMPGSEGAAGAPNPVDQVLDRLQSAEVDQRMEALQQIRHFSDRRVDRVLEDLRRNDPDRVIRQTAQMILKRRKEEEEYGDRNSRFEGHVMVIDDRRTRERREGRVLSKTIDGMGPAWITIIALLWILSGLPALLLAGGLLFLGVPPVMDWLWARAPASGSLDPFLELVETASQLKHAIAFLLGAWQVVGGLGLLLRQEWGRWMTLFGIAVLYAFGFWLRGAAGILVTGLFTAPVVLFLTRRHIASRFSGHKTLEPAKGPTPTPEEDRDTSW